MRSRGMLLRPGTVPMTYRATHPRRRGFPWRAGGALLLLAMAGAGLAQFRDRLWPHRWGVVEEGTVYRSGQIAPRLIARVLRDHGIRTVVDLTDLHTRTAAREAEKRTLQELGIRRVRAPLEGDGRGDLESYVTAIREIVRARASGEPLLVHCQSGVQRAGGVVAAYRLLVQGRSPAETLRELRRFGWRPGRDRVLAEFLDANLPELARRLQAAGLAERIPEPCPRLSAAAR